MFRWSLPRDNSKPHAAAPAPFAGSRSDCDNNGASATPADNTLPEMISASSQEAELLKRAMPQFLRALQAIPAHEKKEYAHAITVVPELVATESDPVAFLRFCNWDGAGAAQRLCVYWRKRKEIFGETRAFLPLLNDFSGNGALGSDDIEILKCGGFCLLPNDSHGRPVGHNDRSRIPPNLKLGLGARLRAGFFVLQQTMQNPVSQTAGVVWVIRGVQSSEGNNIGRPAMALFREVFPIHVHAFHVAYVQEDRRSFFQRYVFGHLLEHFGRFFFKNMVLHDCETTDQFVQRMAKHGVPRASLPWYLGGLASTDGTAAGAVASLQGGTPNAGDAVELVGAEHRQAQLQQFVFKNMVVHDCETTDQFVQRMAKHGAPRASLPRYLGSLESTDGTAARAVASLQGGTPNAGDAVELVGAEHRQAQPQQWSTELSSLSTSKAATPIVLANNVGGTGGFPSQMNRTNKLVILEPITPNNHRPLIEPPALMITPNHHRPQMVPPALMMPESLATTTERTTDEFVMDAVDYRDFHSCCDDADNDDGSIGSQESSLSTMGSFSFEDAVEEDCTALDWTPIPLDRNKLYVFDDPSSNLPSPRENCTHGCHSSPARCQEGQRQYLIRAMRTHGEKKATNN